MTLYRKAQGKTLRRGTSKRVLYWTEEHGEAAQFNCPCGERLVYVTSPPHKIEFDNDGVLVSLGGSCGYTPKPKMKPPRPENWCHFTIKDGVVETMHSDSKCPGGDGSIP